MEGLNIATEFDASPLDVWSVPKTLGNAPAEARLAMDSAVSLINHSLSMGALPQGAAFLGYAALQDISQNGLIRACVQTVADDLTRNFGHVECEDVDKKNALESALKNHGVQKILNDAAGKVGYFGGCLIYIDTGADELRNEIPLSSEELKDLRGFIVIDPVNISPGFFNSTNPLKKDFYKPSEWYVLGKKVHASRVIRVVANEPSQILLPVYNFLGIPQAQILWDYVCHFTECRVATATIAKKFSHTILKTNMTATLLQAGGSSQIDKRVAMIAKYRDNNSITLIDKDREDVIKLETPIGGLTDITKQGLEFLAALNRTPAVKLLGISPSGFNATGESDIRNYYDYVASQQEKIFSHVMDKVLTCLSMSELGEVVDCSFEFNEMGREDEQATANMQKVKADTVAVYVDRSIISPEEAREYIAGDQDNALNFIDPEKMPENMEALREGMEAEEPPDDMGRDDVDKAGAVA